MTLYEKQIADLRKENATLLALLERWQQNYGYREPWLPGKEFMEGEKGQQGPTPKEFKHYKNNQI